MDIKELKYFDEQTLYSLMGYFRDVSHVPLDIKIHNLTPPHDMMNFHFRVIMQYNTFEVPLGVELGTVKHLGDICYNKPFIISRKEVDNQASLAEGEVCKLVLVDLLFSGIGHLFSMKQMTAPFTITLPKQNGSSLN